MSEAYIGLFPSIVSPSLDMSLIWNRGFSSDELDVFTVTLTPCSRHIPAPVEPCLRGSSD